MKCVAVIPARGGSKRIPKKNIKEFHGKPIIGYSIEVALESGLFDQVYVSTDCLQIAKVAREYGAQVPFLRPSDISDDFTGTNPVVSHIIQKLEEKGERFEYVCCLYPTAPFIKKEFLSQGFEKIKTSKYDFVFSATSFSFPPQRSIRLESEDYISANFVESFSKRSQDLEEWLHDAGQFYWGTPTAFKNYSTVKNSKSSIVKLDRKFVQDIDTNEDWEFAEMLYKVHQEKTEADF